MDANGMDQVAGSRLVGRQQEVQDVREHVDAAAAGRGGLLLVAGEPGVGKSTLLGEASRHARRVGFATLLGGCWKSQGALPLWPWIQVLRSVAESGFDVDRDLALTFAEGATSTGLLGDVDPAGARWRLFDRVIGCLSTASQSTPLLVMIDDLQWADRGSLDLLQQIVRSSPSSRIAVIGAYRDTELDLPLAGFLDAVEARSSRINLRGLGPSDVATLSRSVSTALADDTVATVVAGTSGNPFFVKELVRLMAQRGAWSYSGSMPSSVRDVLDHRLERLSSACRDVLNTASVIGVEFDVRVVASAVGVEIPAVLDAIGEAVEAQIVEALPVSEGGDNRFRFVHDLFRQVFCDSLSWSRTQQLHLQVAQAMEVRYGADPGPRLAELADHYLAAGGLADASTVVEYGQRAGKRLASVQAFDEAIELLERSVSVAAGVEPRERARLLVTLGDVRRRARDLAGARTVLIEAANVARRTNDADVLADAALAYGGGLGGFQPIAAADRDVIALLEEALAMLPAVDSPARCRILGRLATELYLTDDVERRQAMSSDALAMARRLDDPGCLAAALYARQVATFGPDGVADRESAVNEILQLAGRVDDRELALWGHLFRSWSLAEQCLPIDDELITCSQLADQLGMPSYRAEVAMRQAVRALLAGDFRAADRLLEVVEAGVATDLFAGATSAALTALRAALQGPHEVLAELVSAILADQPDMVMWRAALIAIYVELDRLDDARREFDAIAATDFVIPRDGLWLNGMYFLAFACFALDVVEHADTLHARLLPYVNQAGVGAYGSVAPPVGLVEATRGHFDEALRWLDIGRRRNLAVGNRAYALFTERERAAVLLARDASGDREQAAALLVNVVAEMRRLGFTGYVTRAETLLHRATQ